MSKNIKILFTLSVITNILLLGLLGGFGIKELREHQEPWEIAKADGMSPTSQEMMQQHIEKARAELKPVYDDMNRTRAQIKSILAQREVDMKKFESSMKHMRELRQEMSERMGNATKEMLVKMPVDERQKMAERLIHGFAWKKGNAVHWYCKQEPYGPQITIRRSQ